jgi:hypothetical protein
MEQQTNTLAMISVGTGAAALLGSGCCCLPIASMIAQFLVPVLATTAIITGAIALQSVAEQGGGGLAKTGIGLGISTFILNIGMFLLALFTGVGLIGLAALLESL